MKIIKVENIKKKHIKITQPIQKSQVYIIY